MAQNNLQTDLDHIITSCTCVGSVLDELTLLRAALRLYADGSSAEDAVAEACHMMSDSVTKYTPRA
jgi:hypothetical protein